MTDKKQHILEHALELFAEKGFEGTSIRDLAARADVNVAMVNYYFGSKEKLFEQLVAHKAAYARVALEELANNPNYSEIEKVDMIIDNHIKKLFGNRKFHRVLHQELMLSQRETLQQAIVEIIYPNSLIMRGVIESGMKSGLFKKVDAPLVIATITGTINQVLLSRRMCNKLLNKDEAYVPYDDTRFAKRLADHLKQVMRSHLLKQA